MKICVIKDRLTNSITFINIQKNMKNKDLAVLVLSCDAYKDLWAPYMQLFHKYWKDSQLNFYFCSDTLKAEDPSFTDIPVGKPVEWSARLLYAVEQIKEPYVLLLLDDYYITKPVKEDELLRSVKVMEATGAGYCRIYPCPAPTVDLPGHPEYGIFEKGVAYRTSTQATIWKTNTLRKFIIPTESVWDFELKGSDRSNEITEPFIGLKLINNNPILDDEHYPYHYLCTAVYKKKWMKEAVELAKKENLELKTGYIKLENSMDYFRRKHYNSLPKVAQHIFDFLNVRLNHNK
jgi:hypothetical protein